MKSLKLILASILLLQSLAQADVKVYPVPPSTIGGGGFLCSTGGSNSSNAFDLLYNTFSSLNISIGVLCTVYQDFTFEQSSNMIGSEFHVFFSASNGSNILGLGALATSTVTLYDAANNPIQSATLSSSLITLNLFSNVSGYRIYELTMPVEVEFTRARVQMSGIFLFSGFRVYEIYYNYSPLPVELAYFKTKTANNNIVFNWKTLSEMNNDYFEILQSSDGREFETIGMVNGMGTTNQVNHYSSTTPLSSIPVNRDVLYFKLRQVDFNGDSHTYGAVKLNLKKGSMNEPAIRVMAGSTNTSLMISNLDETVAYHVELVTTDGKTILKDNINSFSSYEKTLPKLQSGMFIIKVQETDSDKSFAKKVVL